MLTNVPPSPSPSVRVHLRPGFGDPLDPPRAPRQPRGHARHGGQRDQTPRAGTRRTTQSTSALRTRVEVRTEESVDGSGDDQGGTSIKPDVSRRRGPIPGRRAGHPFRTTGRRPAAPWKPVQPCVDARQPAADARQRVNVASNKIDGRKSADIPAKVGGKTGQNGVTAANTVRQTQTSEKRRTFIGKTAISEGNAEGSGEGGAMQGKKAEVLHTTTTTPTPTRTTSTADYKPSTPSTAESRRTTHVTSDTRTTPSTRPPTPAEHTTPRRRRCRH